MGDIKLFDESVSRIEEAYSKLGHFFGWVFLCTPKATLSPSTRIALITENPGGGEGSATRASFEEGCTYIDEEWWNARYGRFDLTGEAILQKQIRRLFEELASRLAPDESGDSLLRKSLAAYFVPFRSGRRASLHRKKDSIEFAKSLWRDIWKQVSPQLVVALGEPAYKFLRSSVVAATHQIPESSTLATGWGKTSACVDHFGSLTLLGLPHLSTFQIFTPKFEPYVDKILDAACAKFSGEGVRK